MINPGALLFRNAPCPPDATIIITGVGHSGTAMVAATLASLGLPIGPDSATTQQDPEMISALLYFLHHDRAALIQRRNLTHPSWGFTFPSLARHLHPPELAQFRSPRLIVVTRDLTAVASRAAISDPNLSDPIAALGNIAEQQTETVSFTLGANCPALMLSYEKFLDRPRLGVITLAAFCGLKPIKDAIETAASTVIPETPSPMDVFNGATHLMNGSLAAATSAAALEV